MNLSACFWLNPALPEGCFGSEQVIDDRLQSTLSGPSKWGSYPPKATSFRRVANDPRRSIRDWPHLAVSRPL